MKHGHRMSTDGDDEWARIIIICTLALARPVCAGFLCAAPYGFLGSSPNSCRHAWGSRSSLGKEGFAPKLLSAVDDDEEEEENDDDEDVIDPQPSASRHLKPSRDCYVTAKPKGIINRTRSRRSKRWHRSSSPLRRASHTPRDSREIAIPRDEHTPDQLWTETEICSKISARAQAKAPPSRSVPDSAGWMRKPKERLQSEERAKQRLRTGGVILRGNNQGISG